MPAPGLQWRSSPPSGAASGHRTAGREEMFPWLRRFRIHAARNCFRLSCPKIGDAPAAAGTRGRRTASKALMRRISHVLLIAIGIAAANLGWTWLERHSADLRMERTLQARRNRRDAVQTDSSTRVKITQFYATAAEITDDDHNTICYGVENARTVRLDPPVEKLTPVLVRCFWVEPRHDTTYKLIAEGVDGSQDSASFRIRVRPAPPWIG